MAFIRWVDKLNRLIIVLVGFFLGLMTIFIFFQVLVRFVFTAFGMSISAPWTEELARYLMIWTVFLGGAVATRRAELIAFEALVHAVPKPLGKGLKYVAHFVSLSFFLILFLIGIAWVNFGLTENAPVMNIPMAYVYLAMPVGAILMIINTVALLLDVKLNKKEIINTDELQYNNYSVHSGKEKGA